MSGHRTFAYSTLALLAVAFVAAVIASNTLLGGIRIDLTENGLYTLAPGTRSLLGNIEEPIQLYLFFSDSETGDVQFLRSYFTRVREMLDEFVAASRGRLSLRVIDPLPFSEDEDRAAQYGLRDLSLGSPGDSIYFGLAATNSVGDEAIIEFFDPNKEAALEYDLARLMYSLAKPEKSVVGLVSGVPIGGGFNPQTQQPSQPWIINQQIRQVFDVRTLGTNLTRIEDDISLLWIVHPVDLDDQTLYAIDQFLLGGGRALIFVDPLAEIAGAMPDPTGRGPATSSSLARLFDAWGLSFDAAQVVADNRYALSVSGLGSRPIRHIGLIGLDADGIDPDDVVSAGLSSINLGTAGYLDTREGAEISLVPLLLSSADSALVPAARFQFLANPDELLDDFVPDAKRYTLAARIEGPLHTAFPDGPPSAEEPGTATETPDTAVQHLTSTDSANVIVVADVDILSDRLWVQVQRSFLGQLATAFANNGDFVTNAIANLSGSSDLIGLKSRAAYSRPFETVEELRRDADARFRATEQQLEAELAETERRLGELQSNREDAGSLLMTPEQRAEIERFQDQQLEIRKELRAVRRDLDSSIEGLGTWLKVINIFLVPLALAVFSLLVFLVKRSRRGGGP